MNRIATSSIEEGLDFAFNLLVGQIEAAGRENPQLAVELLSKITNFVHPRYAGEPEVAFDAIEDLMSTMSSNNLQNRSQVERQLAWLREQISSLSTEY